MAQEDINPPGFISSGEEPGADPFFRDSTLFRQDHYVNPNTVWSMVTEYVWLSGKEQMPVAAASPGNPFNGVPCKIVSLSAPYGQMIVMFIASRVGALPVLPSPIPQDPNLELLEARWWPKAPGIETDLQTHNFTIGGRYVYACKQPKWFTDGAGSSMGATGYDQSTASMNMISPATFVQGLF